MNKPEKQHFCTNDQYIYQEMYDFSRKIIALLRMGPERATGNQFIYFPQ